MRRDGLSRAMRGLRNVGDLLPAQSQLPKDEPGSYSSSIYLPTWEILPTSRNRASTRAGLRAQMFRLTGPMVLCRKEASDGFD